MQQINGSKATDNLSILDKQMIQDIGKQLGANVKRLRKDRGWSQLELSQKSGIDRNYIGQIENGTCNPTINIVAKLAVLFRIKPANLLVPFVRKRTRPGTPVKSKEE